MTSMAIFLDKRYFKEQGVFYKKQMTNSCIMCLCKKGSAEC